MTNSPTGQERRRRTTLGRLAAISLAIALALGFFGGRIDEVRGIGGNESRTTTTVLRPWTEAEQRFCPLAATGLEVHLYNLGALQGSIEERADAVDRIRQWIQHLRGAAPTEIAGAVRTLTAIADRFYDAAEANAYDFESIAPEMEASYTSREAERARQQYGVYMRDHCDIDFG